MRKIFWLVLCAFCCSVAVADEDPCHKRLHVGTISVCLTPDKETVPSLGAKFSDGSIYYAANLPGMHGGPTFKTQDNVYTLANQYELIHWLSGEDALVDDVWRDRMAGTTSDTGGAMNFINYGCKWNEEHTGYYSADGWGQYFKTSAVPNFDLGTDWYIEVVANIGEPLGTNCWLFDLGSLTHVNSGKCGTSVSLYSNGKRLGTNTKPDGNVVKGATIKDIAYTWDDKAVFRFGIKSYEGNQSQAFVEYDGEHQNGVDFDTVRWNRWMFPFHLFRGVVGTEGTAIYRCGPTTIYDIKVWRRK